MARPLGFSPVIWIFLVAEVADPGNEWLMAFLAPRRWRRFGP
jgi:hypothetical protein